MCSFVCPSLYSFVLCCPTPTTTDDPLPTTPTTMPSPMPTSTTTTTTSSNARPTRTTRTPRMYWRTRTYGTNGTTWTPRSTCPSCTSMPTNVRELASTSTSTPMPSCMPTPMLCPTPSPTPTTNDVPAFLRTNLLWKVI